VQNGEYMGICCRGGSISKYTAEQDTNQNELQIREPIGMQGRTGMRSKSTAKHGTYGQVLQNR